MKSRTYTLTIALCVLTCVVMQVATAQETQSQTQDQHHQYKLVDIGTLGGPSSYYSVQGIGSRILNYQGTVASYGDTSAPDPYFPNCFDSDCYLAHAFRWRHGLLTDLGALPGDNNSAMNAINDRGWVAGFSQTGVIDPLANFPAAHAVLWKDRRPIDLGTLGAGYESVGSYVNDGGQVVGFSTIGTDPDPYSFVGTPLHTFLWEQGVMQDIGTLGGPDAGPSAGGINQRNGYIVGASYTSFIPNASTGSPTQAPFLWENGKMTDLGTLGGTIGGASLANNRGQVIGQSNLSGDVTSHPFFWEHGVMTDIGTLGGDTATANWLNDAGAVVGRSKVDGPGMFEAFLWKDGVIRGLGTVGTDPCSNARAINSHGQIVGSSSNCSYPLHAFLWEHGGPMVDLNALVPPNSGFKALIAYNINERGEIAGTGVPAGCDNIDACGHVFLLIPCDKKHLGECEDNSLITAPARQASMSMQKAPAVINQGSESQPNKVGTLRDGFGARYRLVGRPSTSLH